MPPASAPPFAFVDLETTGTRAGGDRITEIGIVRVDNDSSGATPRVSEWSTLVDPEVPIPPAIQALTGITDAMVAAAPTFSRDRARRSRAARRLRVRRAQRALRLRLPQARVRAPRARRSRARVLCTVRLSRRLFPEAQRPRPRRADRAPRPDAARPPSRARRRARDLVVRAGALPRRSRAKRVDAAIKRILRMPEPAAAVAARRARRAARSARRLSLLRRQPAAALHRQEHQPARARRRAFLAATGAARPTCGCRRRSAASSTRRPPASSARCCARRCSSSRGCPRTTARCGARKKPACSRMASTACRTSSPASAIDADALVRRATALSHRARRARGIARARAPSIGCAGDAPRARAACHGTLLRTAVAALRRRMRRRGGAGHARRAARARAGAARDPALARARVPRSYASARPMASASTCTSFATGAGSAPRATTASLRSSSKRRRGRRSTST